MSKKFILIGHKKRQGKDTFANMLKEHLGDAAILAFADPMKEIMADMKGLELYEYENLKNLNEKVRIELQRFGANKMKEYFGDDVWVKLLASEANKRPEKYIIVSDFRFPIEHISGCLTIRVTRDNVELDGASEHISETALNEFKFDINITNNDDLHQLNGKAGRIAEGILNGYF